MQPGMELTVKTLNSFLRGEISATETYRQAIVQMRLSPICEQLQETLRSHEGRVNVLRHRIEQLGGEPTAGSGVWGAFAKLVENGAQLLGDDSAIAALENGEDYGGAQYHRELDRLDAESRQLLELEVLPEQERTHATLSALKKSL